MSRQHFALSWQDRAKRRERNERREAAVSALTPAQVAAKQSERDAWRHTILDGLREAGRAALLRGMAFWRRKPAAFRGYTP